MEKKDLVKGMIKTLHNARHDKLARVLLAEFKKEKDIK